jgi:mannosyltransferase
MIAKITPKVAIDGIIFSLQRHGGITVYIQQLLAVLSSQKDISAELMLESPLQQIIQTYSAKVSTMERSARWLERFRRCRVPSLANVFHSSYYRLPDNSTVPSVVTVHDFIYERFRRGPQRWIHSAQKQAAIRQAQAIICISESTKDDLLEWVGVRNDQSLHVIHNGVSPLFRPIEHNPPNKPFALFVGERRGYKNFKLALLALAHIPDLELHCVGGGGFRASEFLGLSEPIRKRVRHLGFLSDEDLNKAYNQAVCLLYPSQYEGFGIPVVEAMRAGCPVVSINCKAVLEVGGDALESAEDEDPKALAESIKRLFGPAHRKARIERGLQRAQLFDWKTCHEQTVNIYRMLGQS